MYCRNCGSKLLDSDKFCNNCGTRVINDVEIEKTHKNVIENSNKIQEVTNELPMNWWNFWIYFRFPVGILISFLAFLSTIYYLGNTDIDFYIIIYLATNLAYIILMGFSYYNVFQKKKRGYIIFIYYIIAEALLFSFDLVIQNFSPLSYSISEMFCFFIIIAVIWSGIWVYPNYIYFNKRKHLFNN